MATNANNFVCSVSFFGDSHVAMPLQEAKLSTYLRLKFRTRQSNGILFLAAGRTDYCLLSIDDGRVKLNLKINDHFTEVRQNHPTECVCFVFFLFFLCLWGDRKEIKSILLWKTFYALHVKIGLVTNQSEWLTMARHFISTLRCECYDSDRWTNY